MVEPALVEQSKAPEDEYKINVRISQFEWKLIQHHRSLRSHGWGNIAIEYRAHLAVKCYRTFGDNPEMLAALQTGEPEP